MRADGPLLIACALLAAPGCAGHDPGDPGDPSGDDTAAEGTDDTGAEPPSGYGISGCWITHTGSGETQLDLEEHVGGLVTGTLSFRSHTYPVEEGIVDEAGLRFSVEWTAYDQTCDYAFDEVSATALVGTGVCTSQWASTTQDITADRSCG